MTTIITGNTLPMRVFFLLFLLYFSTSPLKGQPTQLAFAQSPVNTFISTVISPSITVEIRDASNQIVSAAGNSVSLSILNNAGGGVLSGTTTVNAINGVATFSGISINAIGSGYTLQATSTGLASATSAVFSIISSPYLGGSGSGAHANTITNTGLGNTWLTNGTSSFTGSSNWSSNTVPSVETAYIPSGGTQPVISNVSTSISTGTSLYIKQGASLTINPDATLAVNGSLINFGTVLFKSDASGTANLGNSAGSISGNISVERYIPAIARRYRMISFGISGFTYAQLIDDIFITGPSGGTGFDASSHSNNPSIYTFQETTGGSGRGWKSVNSINNTLSSGYGALVFIRGDRTLPSPDWYTAGLYPAQNAVTLDYTGAAVTGNISPAITYTNTGDPSSDGYNLIGNPYASAIDWDLVTKQNLSPFYYCYNPATGSYEANNSGTIAGGQAFFVQATASNPSISFTESCKSTAAPQQFFKTTAKPVKVMLYKDSTNSDFALLTFGGANNKGFVMSEDARKLKNQLLNICFITDSQGVQINGYPNLSVLSDTFTVEVGASAGNYQLVFSQFESIPQNKSVLLKDHFTNTLSFIYSGFAYPLSITGDPLSQGKRFEIIIIQSALLPLSILSFNARPEKNDVYLQWTVSSQSNCRHFVIERSADGILFNEIGVVNAQITAEAHKFYAYTDGDIFLTNPSVFYRIKQIDADGKKFTTHTIEVNAKKSMLANSLSVFPNPASNMLGIYSEKEEELYQVFNSLGKEILSVKTTKKQFSIDVSLFPNGSYYIKTSNQMPVPFIINHY